MGNILTTKAKLALTARYVVMVGVGGLCLLMSQNTFAAALFNHIVQPYVETTLMYDSNILRLPNNFTPEMSGNRTTISSFLKQVKAGVATKWQISQQQLILNASVNQNWYSSFNELNYTGYNLLGRWNWQLGRQLKGEISYNNHLLLGGFGQINRLANNLVNGENYVANGAYEVFPDWYLRAGFTRTSTTYQAAQQQRDLIENARDIGIRYMNPLNNMLGFHVTITDGKYPNRVTSLILDNAYTRINYNLEGKWNYSVKTQISGQIGYVSQKYEHLTARNFSAITARADILWEVTRKSTVLLSAWQKVSSSDTLVASFTLNKGIMLTPTWRWSETPKIQVELPISYEQRGSFGNTGLDNGAILTPPKQSNRSIIRLNVNYIPIQNVEMTAFIAYEASHSSNALHSYQDESAGLTMKVSF